MVFTERQKTELKNISKEMSKEIMNEFINDKKFMELFANKIVDIVSHKISEHVEKLSDKINTLEMNFNNIQGENNELRFKIDNLEQQLKLTHLRIYGISEDNEISLKLKLQDLFKSKMGVSDVSFTSCYRIGSENNSGKPRATLIKFENIEQRNMVYYNKKKLKGTKIVISEELTKGRYELLMLAREKLGKKNVWSVNGNIFAMINGEKFKLKNEDDVMKLRN